ncbi:chondroitin AC/alginate lyase [Athelia psychrophila]|uniref:Chondroitin AC/alginate lyase n=1 Tax=Athelia psychrophila TaxID=1759441 RepID=A0A166EK98_9AGAM|nr:chondroitin AC/alginate lyase [Fibularhizoctonia sp. CBS 109695]
MVYDNEFLDPSYIIVKKFPSSTLGAQQTIVEWANVLAAKGPWFVMDKAVLPPSGNKHDYLSWAPYEWPDCYNVHNKTQLKPEQVWAKCDYVNRDGQFNPDRLLVNDTSAFQAMSNAVFYNTVAWVLTGSSNYASSAAHFLDTWFINPATAQTPDLKYAQIHRGPNGQVGTHAGLLDFHQMAKIASAILILREAKSASWTAALDSGMVSWTKAYIKWLTTDSIAHEEQVSANNHGTLFYNQLASLHILANDKPRAIISVTKYFSTLYKAQIEASGEQVSICIAILRARIRITKGATIYRCYNLAAMITNAKIGRYLGLDFWNTTTSHGATIKAATDFTMTQHLNTTDGDGPIWELYPSIVASGAAYGIPKARTPCF